MHAKKTSYLLTIILMLGCFLVPVRSAQAAKSGPVKLFKVPGTSPLTENGSLIWNTFQGTSLSDSGLDIAVDSSENIYIAGESEGSWGLPLNTPPGGDDAYIAKLDSSGSLLWNTFLGGSGADLGWGIAVDGAGNIYITGSSTAAWGTPINPYATGMTNVFVAMLDSNGTLVWNTFFPFGGGPLKDLVGLAVDESGNIFISSSSAVSWGSPLRAFAGGSTDAFVAKLNNSGALVWNTFLGGSAGDESYGLALDPGGNIYVSGISSAGWGTPLNDYAGGQYDAFIARLDSDGTLVWNTFVGGSGSDYGFGIAVDGNGNIYSTGHSSTTWGIPVNPLVGNNAGFLAKLDGAGAFIWNTFMPDSGHGIAVDGGGNIYIAGIPTYAARLDSSGTLVWSTPLGGRQDFGVSIAVAESGNVYLTGISEATWGTPINAFVGGYNFPDAFVAKLANTVLPSFTIVGNAGAPGATLAYTDGVFKTATSAADGSYTLSASYNWSGVVTPTKAGYSFSPPSKTYSNVLANLAGQDYTATVVEPCYMLTRSYTGSGSDPMATPTNSSGCSSGQYHAGESISLSGVLPSTGWQISSWTGTDNDASTSNTNIVTMPASAHTAAVNYTPICYVLTLSHTGQGRDPAASPTHSVGCATGQYVSEANINLSGAAPSTGWRVASWTGTNNNSSTSNTNMVTMPASASSAAVNYAQACYALTLSHTGSGGDPVASPTYSSGCSSGQYHAGESISLSGALPATGWQISSWTNTDNDASTGNTNIATMPAGAYTAGVNYGQICYVLTLSHTGQGSNPAASPANSTGCAAGEYVLGASISLSGAAPSTGWQISSWTGTDNNSSTSSTNTLTMPAGPGTAAVNYMQIEYSLTTSVVGSGSITRIPDQATYHYGDAVQLTAVPAPGWAFADWTGDASGTTNPVFITMNANRAVTANYITQLVSSLTLRSIAGYDGWLLERTELSGLGGTLNASAVTFNLGDDAARRQYRDILSFTTSGLPDNAVITKATLTLRRQSISGGGNPVSMFQGLLIDVRKGFFGPNAGLQATDFQAAASKSIGPFSPVPVGTLYTVNLGSSAYAYINKAATNGGVTQLRLRFKLDDNNNAVANFISFFSGNYASASYRPTLVITYYLP